ncbi:MAG: hypothetical protein K0Q70_121, partial [Rhodospirillales bacterium]|nr:hypothetical protein [Rhodospirillales bacterium]
ALSAGYEHANRFTQGYRLLRRPEIAARVLELREEVAARECQSVAVLLAKLEGAFNTAIKDGNPYAAVRIIELQAKLTGHLLPRATPASTQADADSDIIADNADAGARIVADPNRFALTPAPSSDTLRAALAAVARSSARKRAQRRQG